MTGSTYFQGDLLPGLLLPGNLFLELDEISICASARNLKRALRSSYNVFYSRFVFFDRFAVVYRLLVLM